MKKLKANEFRCALCGGIFDKGWSEEEADKEMKENFGEEMTVENCDSVCDDCYYSIVEPTLKSEKN